MFVYAGIDEAGYGPMLGPLVVARSVFAVPKLDPDADPPHLWQRLSKAVSRGLTGRKGRVPIADSKALKSQAVGIKHLEVGCLAFAALSRGVEGQPGCVREWLEVLGEDCHARPDLLPWYAEAAERPWQPLPCANTEGEIAVARGMLIATAKRIGIEAPDLGACVVLEDAFNGHVARTRSKAATSFTFVAKHLDAIWQRFGEHNPYVVVDRQGGRSHYREQLMLTVPGAELTVVTESEELSAYELRDPRSGRSMRVRFQVEAEASHMPVALASMIAKYTRELFMARFNGYFGGLVPDLKPTAGYATDARRWLTAIEPRLGELSIDRERLCRVC